MQCTNLRLMVLIALLLVLQDVRILLSQIRSYWQCTHLRQSQHNIMGMMTMSDMRDVQDSVVTFVANCISPMALVSQPANLSYMCTVPTSLKGLMEIIQIPRKFTKASYKKCMTFLTLRRESP